MTDFVRYTFDTIPQAHPHEDKRAQELLGDVYDKRLAGYIMRQCGVTLEGGEPAMYEHGAMSLSTCEYGMAMAGMYAMSLRKDFGIHRDAQKPSANSSRLVNFHTTLSGNARVKLFRSWPMIATDELPLFDADTATDDVHREHYGRGEIDSELFVPVCHEAELSPGDTLVFLDWRTAHDFTTLNGTSREYVSRLYQVQLHPVS